MPATLRVAAMLLAIAIASAHGADDGVGDTTPRPTPVAVEVPTERLSALDHTRATLDQTRAIIDSDRTHNQQLEALGALLANFLDTDTMGMRALDKHWSKFSKAQQAEFLVLFRELFQRTYVQKLLLFDRPDFEYVGQHTEEDDVQVDTLIVTPRDEFAVTYRFRDRAGGWLATDIQIEDLSLTTNFRRQLDHLLTKSSVENVLGRMRRKYGERDDAPDPAPVQ